MYDQTNVPSAEYQVRPVVRYVVTKYCHPYFDTQHDVDVGGGSSVICEVANEFDATIIMNAMKSAAGKNSNR